MPTTSRRALLTGLGVAGAGLALGVTAWRGGFREIPGTLQGASASRGHKLRDGTLQIAATPPIDVGTLIIGGGVAGLSAARRLRLAGSKDFTLIELEDQTGGKTASGGNAVSRWPWGAHYLPVPSSESRLVRELLEELGAIQGYVGGVPRFDPEMVCHAPQERLFRNGEWQRGIAPDVGLDSGGRRQFAAFRELMAKFRRAVGRDKRRAFAIPVPESSTDPEFTGLDAVPFATWLKTRGFSHPDLLWYLDYCCRDDYGVTATGVSAWAGIHYFAGRNGVAAGLGEDQLLTWPEGNAWLTDRLRDGVKGHVRTGVMALKVEDVGAHVRVDAFDFKSRKSVQFRAGRVIWAAPQFIGLRVVRRLADRRQAAPSYAPWMVANLRVRVSLDTAIASPNLPGVRVPLCWDNVIQHGRTLGYVNANHQQIGLPGEQLNLTLYWPMATPDIDTGRKTLLARSHGDWVKAIVEELEVAHPGVAEQLEQVDVWRWGHGMVVPTPGAVWTHGPAAAKPLGRVHFAHSDLSGISNFEEAQHHGDRAASEVLAANTAVGAARAVPG